MNPTYYVLLVLAVSGAYVALAWWMLRPDDPDRPI
jgi:hypothetical protein